MNLETIKTELNQYIDDRLEDYDTKTIVQLTRDKIGEEMQGIIKPLLNEAMDSVLRIASKKKGKKYLKAYHWDLMDDLQCYWDNPKELPIDADTKQPFYVKSYFEHLADKYDVHYKTIEAFARNNHPSKTRSK